VSTPFTEYVSLGNNCEGAFQIRRVLGRDNSSFFSWNVTPLPALESLLRTRFAGVLQPDNLTSHLDGSLLNDLSHGHKFHSPFDRIDFRNDHAYECKDHLRTKFLRERRGDESTAYFYKVGDKEERADLIAAACRVRDLLAEIHKGSRFALIILQSDAKRNLFWQEDLIHDRYLARFAPWSDATDGHVRSWDRVFREFPHIAPMRLANF
jgi:Putative papain-like cysteine peptidase (DUF1796)